MEIPNKERPLFTYSIIPILITIILISIVILIIILINHKKEKTPNIVIKEPINKNIIKQKYLTLINKLIYKVQENTINTRKSYQELSLIIRHFIYEMTNIKVQNYTLSDIKCLNIPFLYSLVEEYYDPEFSYLSEGNIMNSILKTKEVIEKWK